MTATRYEPDTNHSVAPRDTNPLRNRGLWRPRWDGAPCGGFPIPNPSASRQFVPGKVALRGCEAPNVGKGGRRSPKRDVEARATRGVSRQSRYTPSAELRT